MYRAAPLPSSFMLMSMIGFLISSMMVYPRDKTWGFAFCLIFIIMFIASIISMTYADISHKPVLDIDKRRPKRSRG